MRNGKMAKVVQIVDFFRNEFLYKVVKSPQFCKWPWILNWSKWTFGRLRNCTHQKEALHSKLIPFAKFVRQWKSKKWANSDWECLLLISIYSSSKFEVTSMNADFDCRYIGTNFKHLSHHLLLFIKILYSTSWVLWSLLFVIKPSETLPNCSF